MRWVVRIFLCLVIGAMLTFIIAHWRAHTLLPPIAAYLRVDDLDKIRDLIEDRVSLGEIVSPYSRMLERPGVNVVTARLEHEQVGGATIHVRRAGWPAYCFASFETNRPVNVTQTDGIVFTPNLHGIGLHFLMFRPIWSGLVVNVVVFTLLPLITWIIAIRLHRRRRADLCRCPGCNYDLRNRSDDGVDITCPECGVFYRAMWFNRPRQLWRAWWLTIVGLWLVLGACATGMLPRVLAVTLPEEELLLACAALGVPIALVIGIVASSAYPDRPKRIRLITGIALGICASIPLMVFVSMFIRHQYGR